MSGRWMGENARRDMILTLEEMGFSRGSSHHEDAPAQHEIDFHYDEALNMADAIMTFKMAVKNDCKTSRTACDIYAEAEDRCQRKRHAHRNMSL